jgi:MoaA/NifB/PqqE/SkfB family radical SAM enzyme
MEKLEDIGFYTLSDYRASQISEKSPLWRCELILTDKCNFKCPYCRGLRSDITGTMLFELAMRTLQIWVKNGLKNVRFSGGEPTLYNGLEQLINYCKSNNVEKIAVSTNGSANREKYENLIKNGVGDFSISLDACCSSVADKMSGGISGMWQKVVENIRWLSKEVYTTVGIVVNEENLESCVNTILFAESLGVSDIRVIPSAQYDIMLKMLEKIPQSIIDKYKILNYRVNRSKCGKHVRGLNSYDCNKCHLVLDDMAVAGDYHFPCIIYIREQGNPIGRIGENMRYERKKWSEEHNCFEDPICRKNCLDVCIDFNNKIESLSVLK